MFLIVLLSGEATKQHFQRRKPGRDIKEWSLWKCEAQTIHLETFLSTSFFCRADRLCSLVWMPVWILALCTLKNPSLVPSRKGFLIFFYGSPTSPGQLVLQIQAPTWKCTRGTDVFDISAVTAHTVRQRRRIAGDNEWCSVGCRMHRATRLHPFMR